MDLRSVLNTSDNGDRALTKPPPPVQQQPPPLQRPPQQPHPSPGQVHAQYAYRDHLTIPPVPILTSNSSSS
ncbi:hypothetical protein G7046_g8500 [Stylonectria norvegica]|nr:hypothetical protein G7046_g8500 [Stylonectria norvegica]